MTFEEFKNLCTNIQNMSLPGESSQLKMAPASRLVEQKIQSKQNNTARKAGVMVLFYGYDSLNVALIRRTIDGSVHSGQIARSEEHTSELQSRGQLVCRLLLEKNKNTTRESTRYY